MRQTMNNKKTTNNTPKIDTSRFFGGDFFHLESVNYCSEICDSDNRRNKGRYGANLGLFRQLNTSRHTDCQFVYSQLVSQLVIQSVI